MPDALVPAGQGLSKLLAQGLEFSGLTKPFVQEIYLLTSHIAGTTHRDLKDIEAELIPGNTLVLLREPENVHDPMAIKVLTTAGAHLGYVPRKCNEILARLMDAGKKLDARLEAKEWREQWLRIEISIHMTDV